MQPPPPSPNPLPTAAQSARPPLASSAPFLQGLVLLVLALVCVGLKVSDIRSLDPFLVVGLGCLLAFVINPRRLFIPLALFLPLGVVNVLASSHIIDGSLTPAYYFIGLALGLMAIASVTQQKLGWVQPGALSPGWFVFLLGVVLLESASNGTLGQLLFSLWLPVILFGGLGVSYLVQSAFGRGRA